MSRTSLQQKHYFQSNCIKDKYSVRGICDAFWFRYSPISAANQVVCKYVRILFCCLRQCVVSFFRLVPVEFFPAGAGGRFTAKIAGLPTAPGTVSQGFQLRVITDGSECRDCRFCSVVQQVVA